MRLLVTFATAILATTLTAAERPVATYSIVARDATTGELGVAVQSHWFSVGSVVSWPRPASARLPRSRFIDPSYGPLALDLLRAGRSAPEALSGLLTADSGRDVRQVAIVDASGRVAAHTGARCIAAAGHATGDGFSVQANLMDNDAVWPAMHAAFTKAQGDLADRLLAALDAAQAAGGDIRGKQSAALLVVRAPPPAGPGSTAASTCASRTTRSRSSSCVGCCVWRAPTNARTAVTKWRRCSAGRGRPRVRRGRRARPEIAELPFWHAAALATAGRLDEARPLFAAVFAREPRWRELVPRLPAAGLLPDDQELIAKIVAIGR